MAKRPAGRRLRSDTGVGRRELFRRLLRMSPRRSARRPSRQPSICRACALPFVLPQSAVPHGGGWHVTLRCANCGWTAEDVLDQDTVGRLQQEIDRGREQLVELLALVTGRRMRD